MPVARFVGVLAVAALVAMQTPGAAFAHVRSTEGTAVVRQDDSTVRVDLSLEYQLLAAAAGLGNMPENDSAQVELLVKRRERLEAYLTERITVSLDGVGCSSALASTGVQDREGTAYARSLLMYDCPGSSPGSYRVRYDVFSDTDSVVDGFTTIIDYQLGGASGTFVFDPSHRELEAGRTGILAATVRFVAMGVEHIFGGLDHVLFLVALLIGARGLSSVVKLATAFTVAHSLTLALGAIGWVHVPAEIVEPLIALSIAYVALQNLIGGESRHRLVVVFGFGLLHGLGFASTLAFTDGFSGRLLGSLVSFNLGIELGQALIIALLFPLLLLIRRFAWSGTAHTAATALAGVIGMVWFFQRLMA